MSPTRCSKRSTHSLDHRGTRCIFAVTALHNGICAFAIAACAVPTRAIGLVHASRRRAVDRERFIFEICHRDDEGASSEDDVLRIGECQQEHVKGRRNDLCLGDAWDHLGNCIGCPNEEIREHLLVSWVFEVPNEGARVNVCERRPQSFQRLTLLQIRHKVLCYVEETATRCHVSFAKSSRWYRNVTSPLGLLYIAVHGTDSIFVRQC